MFVALRSCAQGFWESSLMGPYLGLPYMGHLPDNATSTLDIPKKGIISIYEIEEFDNPVLLIQTLDGKIISRTLLIPQRTNQEGVVGSTYLREMSLNKLSCHIRGYKVYFICDWGWGGIEKGLLYLNRDLSFKEMCISW